MRAAQKGFALIESMIALVVFAILLIALLNYAQYIILNFNQIYQDSAVNRQLHSALEMPKELKSGVTMNTGSINAPNKPDLERVIHTRNSPKTEYCSELIASLQAQEQKFSLGRWFCVIGESHVSDLSF